MKTEYELYASSIIKGSYFNAMLDCGRDHNWWLELVLKYLPEDVFDQNKERFLFTSTATRDACRVARHYCQTREIILLSERILPGQKVRDETDPKARYFIYVVLHEVAHAIRNHKSPKFDNLTNDEYEAQEKEADELAMTWFNEHVTKRNNKYLHPITNQEIEAAQAKNRKLMENMTDNDELKPIIYEFFFKFSRFEFALKEYKYRKPGKYNYNAEPDWNSFVNDFEKAYQASASATKLLQNPPRKQIIKNGNLDWEDLSFGKSYSLLKKVTLSIKTIRNNLFHGGKHGDKSWDDTDRIKFLLVNGNGVIDHLASLHDELRAHYRDEY